MELYYYKDTDVLSFLKLSILLSFVLRSFSTIVDDNHNRNSCKPEIVMLSFAFVILSCFSLAETYNE